MDDRVDRWKKEAATAGRRADQLTTNMVPGAVVAGELAELRRVLCLMAAGWERREEERAEMLLGDLERVEVAEIEVERLERSSRTVFVARVPGGMSSSAPTEVEALGRLVQALRVE